MVLKRLLVRTFLLLRDVMKEQERAGDPRPPLITTQFCKSEATSTKTSMQESSMNLLVKLDCL